jgi:hypothetical protein
MFPAETQVLLVAAPELKWKGGRTIKAGTIHSILHSLNGDCFFFLSQAFWTGRVLQNMGQMTVIFIAFV